jgi:hypothetical protein
MRIIGFNIFFCCFLLESLCCSIIKAEEIKVGGYHFPPFVKVSKNNVSGITKKMLHEMNIIQKKYRFVFFLTSPKRRYYDFEQGKFDLIIFEDLNWGWKKRDIAASKVFLKGAEVYITKASPSKDQTYFNHLKNKNIAIIKGYHYGFANYNSDENYLRKNFNVQFSSYHEGNILKVVFGRADISVVNLCFLRHFFFTHPEKKDQLLISDKVDQRYNHTILLRKKALITIKEINAILTKMENEGIMARLTYNNNNPIKPKEKK